MPSGKLTELQRAVIEHDGDMADIAGRGCQQILRVETSYWQQVPECGKPVRFTWTSDLRGKLRLCRRHAKAVGIEHCKPIEDHHANRSKVIQD